MEKALFSEEEVLKALKRKPLNFKELVEFFSLNKKG